jgi:hypothetical protein
VTLTATTVSASPHSTPPHVCTRRDSSGITRSRLAVKISGTDSR